MTCNLANQHRKRYCNSIFYWEHIAVAVNIMFMFHHIHVIFKFREFGAAASNAEVTDADSICQCLFCATFLDVCITSPYWWVHKCRCRHHHCHWCGPQNNVCHFAHCFYMRLCCFDKNLGKVDDILYAFKKSTYLKFSNLIGLL